MSRTFVAARAYALAALGLALAVAGLQVAAPAPATADPAGTHLVINEFSGGNGTGTGATDEYVELYNPTSETITFTGTIQYKSAVGSTYSAVGPVTTFVVAPHGYWLIAGVNYSGSAAPDSHYSFDASASVTAGGHIALTGATTGVTTPAYDPLRVDLVGWGTANTPEGTAAPYHPAAGGSLRRTNGIDTDNNSVDFRNEAVRSPRGSGSNSAITITNPGSRSLAVGTLITPFTLAAAGGRGSYAYAVTSGSLPAGLTLAAATGEISGTPTAARAASNVTVRATDAVGDPVFATFSIEVTSGSSPVEVTSPGDKTFTVGQAVTPFSVEASGGVAPYGYEVTSGSLPAGVELDPATGEVSGTPTAARAASSVTVTVTDADDNMATTSFSVGVELGSLTSAVPVVDDTRPMVGEVLTASPGAWVPAPVTLAYQWLADGEDIEDATTGSLTVTAGLVGAALSVRVTGSRPEFTSVSVESAGTAAVVATLSVASPGAKSFTVGSAVTPFSLAASGGVAPYTFEASSGSLPTGVELDSDSGEMSGTPASARLASLVTVEVTDSDENTASVSFSVGVAAGSLTSALPTIDDTRPMVGEVLAASPGAWSPEPVTLAYQWLADGEEIEDATEASLSVTQDLVGAALSVRVTGSRPEYDPVSVESAETAVVVAGLSVASPGVKTFTVGQAVAPFSVEASGGVAPYGFQVTAGSLPAGVVLDPETGEVSGTPTAARAASSVTVTATDADENTASTSISVGVAAGSLTSAVPTVDDTRPVVGEVLTASPGSWGPAPVTLAYQWLADGEEIEDATEASLTVTAELIGAVLSVRVMGSRAEYEPVSVESADTAVVVAAVSVASPGVKTFTVGQAVAPFSVEASGGVAPYGFQVTAGSLPAGVVLDPETGEISGTPTAARAASEITVTVTDADENIASATFSISVLAGDVPGVPDTGGPKPDPQPETTPTKSRVVVRMATVVLPPTKRARLRVLADGRGVTGRVTIRVGKRIVTARAVDGVVRLSSAQVRKLVVRARSQEATAGKPTQSRPWFRKVRATLRYAGPTTDDFTTRFVIRVKRR